MEWFVDPRRGEWLQERIAELGPMIPSGMAAYARILHPATAWRPTGTPESPDTEWLSETWRWVDVAAHNRTTLSPASEWPDISPDSPAVEGWTFSKPHDGWIDPVLLATLVPALRAHTTTPDAVTLAVWEGWGFASLGSPAIIDSTQAIQADNPPNRGNDREPADSYTDALLLAMDEFERSLIHRAQHGDLSEFPLPRFALPDRRYVLGASALSELRDPAWPHRAGLGWAPEDVTGVMPQLIWPEDHAWCISVEVDAPYTLIAGPEAMIAAVLAMPELETQLIPEASLR